MGTPILPKVQKITVCELLADLRPHYETTGQQTLHEAETRLTPLTQFFTSRRASAVSGDVLTAYIQHRKARAWPMGRSTVNSASWARPTSWAWSMARWCVVPSFTCSKRPDHGKDSLSNSSSSVYGYTSQKICKSR